MFQLVKFRILFTIPWACLLSLAIRQSTQHHFGCEGWKIKFEDFWSYRINGIVVDGFANTNAISLMLWIMGNLHRNHIKMLISSGSEIWIIFFFILQQSKCMRVALRIIACNLREYLWHFHCALLETRIFPHKFLNRHGIPLWIASHKLRRVSCAFRLPLFIAHPFFTISTNVSEVFF